ncbi:MAG: thioredoxin family protein [Bacteroidales bacterium]|nr:thioredoxin family protein [Bacteroidales bacterium]
MKKILLVLVTMVLALSANAQAKKYYDETVNPIQQIDKAVAKAKASGKNVVCQVGGNWCRWCLMFAKFIESDKEISGLIDKNYEYIHVNWPQKGVSEELKKRLNNAGRFGFPVFVVLDGKGDIIHIQDSSYLEEGQGYNKEKVMRFFEGWTPQATK